MRSNSREFTPARQIGRAIPSGFTPARVSYPCRFTFSQSAILSRASPPLAAAAVAARRIAAAKQYQQHYANETVPPARKRWNPIQGYYPPPPALPLPHPSQKPRFGFCRSVSPDKVPGKGRGRRKRDGDPRRLFRRVSIFQTAPAKM